MPGSLSIPMPVLLKSARRSFTSLCALAGAAGLLTAAAPSASAAVFGTQGFGPGESVAQSLATAQRAGAKVFRVEASWAALEPQESGTRDPAAVASLDAVVAATARHGMRTVLFIDRTPCWASAAPDEVRGDCTGRAARSPDVTRYRPADPASVVPVATFLAHRYAARLAAFQVWNEPDQANEKYWAGSDKVESYSAMVKALYKPLKQAAPKVPVLAGSFVGINGRWLQAMYRQGVKGFYDGLAVQFYGVTNYDLRTTRATQLANGDHKPLWLTEFGYTDCYRRGGPLKQLDQNCVSSGAAAQALTDVLTAVRKRSWIAAAIQYDLRDDPPGGYTFGLVDLQGRHKSTWTAVRRVLTGRVRSPRRPVVRLRANRGHVDASGTASLTELQTARVFVHGVLRYRATFVTDRTGHWALAVPAVLGTRGIRVSVSGPWTGARSARLG